MMQFHDTHNLYSHRLTLFAMYVGAFLYFAALIPDFINYVTSPDPVTDHSVAALGVLSVLLFSMAYLYGSGHNYAINVAIVSMALSVPFTFDSLAFMNASVPQGIWLPFIFALAVSNFRVAWITFAVSVVMAFFTYAGAFRTPRAIVETMVIFLMLVLGRLIIRQLMHDSMQAELLSNQSKIQSRELEIANRLISESMLNGFVHGQILYQDGLFSDFVYLKVNSAFEKITGLNNVVDRKFSEVVSDDPEENKERLTIYARVASTGDPEHNKIFLRRLNKWFQLSVSSPKPHHFIAIFEAIPDQIQIGDNEDSATTSAQETAFNQYSAMIRYAPASIAMLDKELNYLAWSQKWLSDNSRGNDDLTGLNHLDVNPDLPAEWIVHQQEAMHGKAISNIEFVWDQRDGSQRWLRCCLHPWNEHNGEIGGLIISTEDITDRKITEADLNSVLGESGDAIWICNTNGNFIYSNSVTSQLTGYSFEELTQLKFANLINEQREDELQEYLALTQYAKFTRREWRLNHKNGATVTVELTTGHLPGGRMIALARDLTEQMQIESERFKLFQAVEQNPGSIMITNINGDIEYVNAAFMKKTGFNRLDVMGQNPRMIRSNKTPPQIFVDLWATIKNGETWQGEISNVGKNGQEFIQFTTISPIRQSNGKITNYIAIGEDITGRKKGEERIFELAYFDQLTGLPNRTLLLDRLNQVIALSSRSGVFGALLFIDLDHFKNINDTLGHQKGDLVLKQVAECLSLRLREGDTVARFGGDEFVVLLTGLGTDDEAAANNAKSAAIKLLEALNQTYQLGDVVHHSTASIGVSLFNGKFTNTDELLKQADLAMYKSKKAGRNTLRFFDPSLESAMKQQATLEEDLRVALRNHQFILQYQGQFTSESLLTGAEVLIRWKHPEKGVMSPALFIPFAEESGQILSIGNWVLETACKQLAAWGKIPTMSQLMLAVNVSALQFRQGDFIDNVLAVIRRTGADPHRLKLELTESMLVENVDDIIQKMLTLKSHGIGFSLDDFGTGYSSLSFLKRLPLDQLKIDQSFIRDVHSDPNGAAIAKTIVALGKSLGLNVIAEGVETNEQREFLAQAGCYTYQGYLFSHPLAIRDFEEMAGAAIHH